MRKQLSITGLASLALIGLTAASATAEPKLRVQVEQPGDFALIGSSLGQECRRATPSPMAGTVGDCGESTVESGPDLFWRSASPAARAPSISATKASFARADRRSFATYRRSRTLTM